MKLKREQIQKHINDETWQTFRLSLKGLPTEDKLSQLEEYKRERGDNEMTKVQILNYLNALKRAGLLSKEGKPKKRGL